MSGVGNNNSINYRNKFLTGDLNYIDDISSGDSTLASAIAVYENTFDGQNTSIQWQRAMRWVENILFANGRHYLDDILSNSLIKSADGDLSVARETIRQIPKPTADILGRYIETNVGLLTENRPRPRVLSKSDRSDDQSAAQLSELTLEYLWEALDMPHLHRQIARILLVCGTCWLEISYDPTKPRRISVPETELKRSQISPAGLPGAPPVPIPFPQNVPKRDPKTGKIIYTEQVEYGDISARIVSPFEMYIPQVHSWGGDDLGWVMREYYVSKGALIDQYTAKGLSLSKRDGWHLEALDKMGSDQVNRLPVWWWERLSQTIEGGGSSFYAGSPELWKDFTIVRIFDRKPNSKWPRGRTVIVAGGQVLYDSPKKVGARAYDPRWPDRWHPYIIFRWEPTPASDIYCRSLVTKILPSLKRIDAIDASLIMWRRTVPMASWVIPKGTQVIEDQWSGGAGQIFEFDPRRTAQHKPEPVYPPPFPEAMLAERQMMLQQIEAVSGTEEILRGQRPSGVTSAAMLDTLRKQALASRSAILQDWDESLQKEGTALLTEVIKNIRKDSRYAERIRILAREKTSRLSIEEFSGSDLSDNVIVKVDTVSLALSSKEARESRALEFARYVPALMSIPYIGLRQAIVEELGFGKSLTPQGPDIERAKRMISWIRSETFERVIPFVEDDPYIFYELLVKEMKDESFWDMTDQQRLILLKLIDSYKQQITQREEAQMKMMMLQASMKGGGQPPEGQGQ